MVLLGHGVPNPLDDAQSKSCQELEVSYLVKELVLSQVSRVALARWMNSSGTTTSSPLKLSALGSDIWLSMAVWGARGLAKMPINFTGFPGS